MPRDDSFDVRLSPDELQRYHRHLILPGIGEQGQLRLKASRVLIVGAGGLGSPAALYLAAAGVGHIGIVDADVVELSNLQRQVLHGTRDVGKPKVASGAARLSDINPSVNVATYHTRLTSENALRILGGYDVIVDGTDNFPTRYLINDACVMLGKPNVHGSVTRFDGQVTVLSTGRGPCYRCLFPQPLAPGTIPDCAEGGVFGVLPGLVGILQATETIKLITLAGESLVGRLLLVDALRMRFQTIEVPRDPSCPACGTGELTELIDYERFCGFPERDQEGIVEHTDDDEGRDITPTRLNARLRNGERITLIDVREPHEWPIAHLTQARLVPLSSLPRTVDSMDPAAETVVYCHHGMRSEAACAWLRDRGFTNVRNLSGGIDRWALEVDPTFRRY